MQPDALWEHVLWIFDTCDSQRVDKVQLRLGDRAIHIFLPWDGAVEWVREPPIATSTVAMRVRGGRLTYTAGDRTLKALPDVRAHLVAEQRAASRAKPDYTFAPVLKAERRLRAVQMFDALEMLVESGMRRVLFYEIVEQEEADGSSAGFESCRWIPYPADRDKTTLPSRK